MKLRSLLSVATLVAASGVAMAAAPELVLISPEAGATVESVSEIIVGNVDNAAMTFVADEDNPAGISYGWGGLIMLEDPTQVAGNPSQWKFKIEPLTADGRYMVNIPEGYFTINGESCEGLFETFFIETPKEPAAFDILPKSVTPEQNTPLEELSVVKLTFADPTLYPMSVGAPEATIYDMEANTVVCKVTGEENDWSTPTEYTFTLSEAITEPGTYKFSLPKGAFCDEDYDMSDGETGHASDELNYTFVVGKSEPVELVLISPESGATVESVSEIIVGNSDNAPMTFVFDEDNPAGIMCRGWGPSVMFEEALPVEGNPSQMKFVFDTITEDGLYMLQIPEGSFTINGVACAELFETFVVETPKEPAAYDIEPESVTPLQYTPLEELSEVTLTFAEPTLYPMYIGSPEATIYKVDMQSNTEVCKVTGMEDDMWAPMEYTFTLPEAITEPGTYMFSLPKGAFCDEDYDYSEGEYGHASDELNYFFIVGIPEPPEPAKFDLEPVSVDPEDASHLKELSSVTLKFKDVTYYTMGETVYATVYIVDNENDAVYTYTAAPAEENDWSSPTEYTFTLENPITKDGIYRFVIQKGKFFDEDYDMAMGETGHANPELIFTYYVGSASGIAGIAAEDGLVTVYTLNGVMVFENAPAAELENLAAGYYVVNGVKVYKK